MRKLTETNLRRRRRELKKVLAKIEAMVASGEWDSIKASRSLPKQTNGLLELINNARNLVSHVSEGCDQAHKNFEDMREEKVLDENSYYQMRDDKGNTYHFKKSKYWTEFDNKAAEGPKGSWFVPIRKRGELAVSVKNIIDEWDLNYTMAEVIKCVHAASMAQGLQERLLQTENALNLIREEVDKVKKRIKLFNN